MKRSCKKILIVEDDQESALLLKTRLESEGFEVILSSSGQEGLMMARHEKPNLIILDVMLPIMDGCTICRLLKFDKRFQHIPILLLTGRAGTSDKEKGTTVKADGYITKPFDPRELLSIIQNLIQ